MTDSGLLPFAVSTGPKSRSRWSIRSEDSVLSIGSRGSVLSIGSVGSALSIGSVGSFASIGSVASFASAGCLMSALSWLSVMSWRARRGVLAAGRDAGTRFGDTADTST